MSLHQLITAQFGQTGSAASDETFSKEAQAKQAEAQIDLFLKMASQEGLDLNAIPESQVLELWDRTFGANKTAGAAPPADDLEQRARAEVGAQQTKVAEAQRIFEFGDAAGKHIWDRFYKEAQAAGVFPFPPKKDKDGDGKTGEPPPFQKKDKDADEGKKDDKKDEKKASAFDEYTHAVALAILQNSLQQGELKLASDFIEVLPQKLWAANTVVPATDPRSKLASAGPGTSFEARVTNRALELIEIVGIPVNYGE